MLKVHCYILVSPHSLWVSVADTGKITMLHIKKTYNNCNVVIGIFCTGCGIRRTGETSCGRACNCCLTWDCDALCCCVWEHDHGCCPCDRKGNCSCVGEHGGCACDRNFGSICIWDGDCDFGPKIDSNCDCGVCGSSSNCVWDSGAFGNSTFAEPPLMAVKSNCRANFRGAKSEIVSLCSIYFWYKVVKLSAMATNCSHQLATSLSNHNVSLELLTVSDWIFETYRQNLQWRRKKTSLIITKTKWRPLWTQFANINCRTLHKFTVELIVIDPTRQLTPIKE